MKNRFSVSLLAFLLLVAVAFSCVACAAKKGDPTPGDGQEQGAGNYNVEDCITATAQVRNTHTKAQFDYIHGNVDDLPTDAINGKSEQSIPAPVTLTWEDMPDASEYTVAISERPDLDGAQTVKTIKTRLERYNLKAKTLYWYQITADTGEQSEVRAFMTDGALPRMIKCDGVTNMRDLGGYTVDGGMALKQGMIYRSGRLNKNSSSSLTVEITKTGKKTMLETLGVKTEIDLRQEKDVGGLDSLGQGTERSVLGKTVKYYNCAMEYDPSAYQTANYPAVKQVFALLADEESYPLFFHCSIVADLIGGVLGVDRETLQRDYLFSNFGNIGGSRSLTTSSFVKYVDAIDNTAGDTFTEKVENFLVRTIGVKKAHIDKLREIMLEQAVYEPAVIVQAPTATENGMALHRCTSDPMKTYFTLIPAGTEEVPAVSAVYGAEQNTCIEKIVALVRPLPGADLAAAFVACRRMLFRRAGA